MHTIFYKILSTFDHAACASKLTILAKIALKRVLLEPRSRGQTSPEFNKYWCPLTFWPNVPSLSLKDFSENNLAWPTSAYGRVSI